MTVDAAAREGYRRESLSLAQRLAGGDAESAVWEVYAGTEKLVAILKFRLDYETPGAFTKLPDASDPARLLKGAGELLSKASEEIAEGKLVESVGTLRKARDDLRSYLTAARKTATKPERDRRAAGQS